LHGNSFLFYFQAEISVILKQFILKLSETLDDRKCSYYIADIFQWFQN